VVGSVQTAPSQDRIKTYLVALVADDVKVRNWTRPTPKPPAAPASSPNITNKGTFSRIDFFADFAIRYLH
jgi:hypothetical protein